VIRRLDKTIRKRGLFIVFSNEGDLIGMSNFNPVFDKSGWLGMWRTDPKWRGRGVAQFVQRNIAKHAKRKGITELRCFILSTNTSSLRAAAKGGFKVVSHGTHVTSASKTWNRPLEDQPDLRPFTGQSIELNQILGSNYNKRMNHYLRYGYAFVRTNEANLRLISKRKELFSSGDSRFVLKRTEKDYAEFYILSGRMRETLLKILAAARRGGMKTIGGFIPHDYHVIGVCTSMGFKVDSWGKHGLIFEKQIYVEEKMIPAGRKSRTCSLPS
jgi:GNAT superfamily N-acetyltransferase